MPEAPPGRPDYVSACRTHSANGRNSDTSVREWCSQLRNRQTRFALDRDPLDPAGMSAQAVPDLLGSVGATPNYKCIEGDRVRLCALHEDVLSF